MLISRNKAQVCVFLCVCAVICVFCVDAFSGDIKSEDAALAKVRQDQRTTRALIDAKNKEYFRYQHDIVYTNGPAKGLYQEVKALEKTLNAKRAELSKITESDPRAVELEQERADLYNWLKNLEDREQLMLNKKKVVKVREK